MHFCQNSIVKALRVVKHAASGTTVTRVYSRPTHCVAMATVRHGDSGGQTDKRAEKKDIIRYY